MPPHRWRLEFDETLAEEILMEWANLEDPISPKSDRAIARLVTRYPAIFQNPVADTTPGAEWMWIGGIRQHLRAAWDAADSRERDWYIFKIRDLYNRIALLFQESRADRGAAKTEDKLLMKALGSVVPGPQELPAESSGFEEIGRSVWERFVQVGLWVEPPPTITPFEQVMYSFQCRSRSALHCPNPSCPAPYFFRQEGDRGRRYCGDDCSRQGRLESKSRWWDTTGKARRMRKTQRMLSQKARLRGRNK